MSIFQGKCSLDEPNTCTTFYHDNEIDDTRGNSYLFTTRDKFTFQIRRFNSRKMLAYLPNNYLSNFECGDNSLKKSEICNSLIKDYQGDLHWTLIKLKEQGENNLK